MVRIVTGKRERGEGEKARKWEKRVGNEGKRAGKSSQIPWRWRKQAAKTAIKPTLPAVRHAESHCSQHTVSQWDVKQCNVYLVWLLPAQDTAPAFVGVPTGTQLFQKSLLLSHCFPLAPNDFSGALKPPSPRSHLPLYVAPPASHMRSLASYGHP